LTDPATAAPPGPIWRSELRYLLELLALTGLAIAQPVLDVFGRSPETFVLEGAGAGSIILFCVVVCLGPPLVLLLGASLTNVFGRGVRRWVQVIVLSVLFGLFVLQVMKKTFDLEGAALVIASALLAVAFGAMYLRAAGLRLWLRYLAAAPLLFAVLFLVSSEVSPLLSESSASVAKVEVGSPHPVVILTLDEFPLDSIMRSDGTIDAELYPGFARLAASSTWYRNATTVALRTFYAVPAILTGRYAGTEQHLPVLSSYPQNLFTLLGGSFDVQASQTITRLCPKEVCKDDERTQGSATSRLLDRAGSVYRTMITPEQSHSEVSESVEEATATIKNSHGTQTERPARFEDFLDGLKPSTSKRPTLDFLHILMPHGPHRYYSSGALYGVGDAPIGRGGGNGDRWTTDAGLVSLSRQRHLLQVQYTDHLISQMIDTLQAEGIWDDAIVVVSPDHGIAYDPGESSRNGYGDFVTPPTPELLWIPLFIKAPGQTEGVNNDADVRTIDIVPTVADLLDVKIPWHVDGVSAVGDQPRTEQKKRFFGSWAHHGVELPGTAHAIDPVAGNAWIRAHAVDLFRDPGDPKWALYRWGPHPELVGRQLSALRIAAAPVGRGELGEAGRFAHAAPSQGRVPGIVYGDLDTGGSEPIAVAINGTVGAVVPRLTGGDSADFGALPPDWLWRDGKNDVRLFLVKADGTLAPLAISES
jgi:Sulfatase